MKIPEKTRTEILSDIGGLMDAVVYESGYIAGHEKALQSSGTDAYKNGLEDAWKLARKICTEMTRTDLIGQGFTRSLEIEDEYEFSCLIFNDYSVDEAIEMMKKEEVNNWKMSSDHPDKLICPCCDAKFDVMWMDKGSNYCPNCGNLNRYKRKKS